MAQSLQSVNHNNQLIWWSQKVEECRKSGLKVAEWCDEVRALTPQQYRWLMEGLKTEQPKANKPVTGLSTI